MAYKVIAKRKLGGGTWNYTTQKKSGVPTSSKAKRFKTSWKIVSKRKVDLRKRK